MTPTLFNRLSSQNKLQACRNRLACQILLYAFPFPGTACRHYRRFFPDCQPSLADVRPEKTASNTPFFVKINKTGDGSLSFFLFHFDLPSFLQLFDALKPGSRNNSGWMTLNRRLFYCVFDNCLRDAAKPGELPDGNALRDHTPDGFLYGTAVFF